MSANTSFLNLYKPGGGSSGLIVPDEVVDIDRLNSNMDLIDDFASSWGLATRQTRDFTGPAASLSSIVAAAGGARLGDTYQETDSNKLFWKYDGTNWINNEGGMWLIRPLQSNLVGGTINANGEIVPSSASIRAISVNNCFTSRFRNYVIEFALETGDSNGSVFRFRSGGVDYAAAEYRNTEIYASSAAVTSSFQTGSTQWGMASVAGSGQGGIIELMSPALAVPKLGFKRTVGNVPGSSAVTAFGTLESIGTLNSLAMDGFTYALSSGSGNNLDQTKSWLKIYGKA